MAFCDKCGQWCSPLDHDCPADRESKRERFILWWWGRSRFPLCHLGWLLGDLFNWILGHPVRMCTEADYEPILNAEHEPLA